MEENSRVFVIAEAGSNWRVGSPARDRQMIRDLVDVAVAAGADAIKFQTFRAADLYADGAGESDYLAERGIHRSINEVLAELEMPYGLIPEIADMCDRSGIEFMSTPFSVADADAVDPFVRHHKVASYEINHVRLLQALAMTGKPLLISTGAATEEDIEFSLATVRTAGATDITLLQCTASYPAPAASLNLRVIPWLRERFGVPSGFSDHSSDPIVGPVAAVALGATVVEKHFTTDKRLPGPDHAFAVEPHELKAMVEAIRGAELARGSHLKTIGPAEVELRSFAVRSIQATRAIDAGEAFVEGQNVDVLRPGKRVRGLHPRYIDVLASRAASRPISAGDGIGPGDVDPPLGGATDG